MENDASKNQYKYMMRYNKESSNLNGSENPEEIRRILNNWTPDQREFSTNFAERMKISLQGMHATQTKRSSVWTGKVARYLAFCIDGGLLQSKFTFKTLIECMQKISEPEDEAILHGEIAYLLHLRSRENPEHGYRERLGEALKDMNPT